MTGQSRPVAAQRLTVMLGSRDRFRHRSLAVELVGRARRMGMAGATLVQAAEGQGRSGSLRRQHLFVDDAALALIVIDAPDRIAEFLEASADILADTVVTVTDLVSFRTE